MRIAVADLAMIVALCREIPRELLPSDPDDYAAFVAAVAASQGLLDSWEGDVRSKDSRPLHGMRAFSNLPPVTVLRNVLRRCPEEATLQREAGLEFVADESLRDSLRLDLTRARRAAEREDFKSATVLSGSVIEALLLERLLSVSRQAIESAHAAWKSRSKRPSDPKASKTLGLDLTAWTLHELASIASNAGVITDSTASAVDVARDFRNLIHPGRVRTTIPADEGTAYASLGAALRLAAELASTRRGDPPPTA